MALSPSFARRATTVTKTISSWPHHISVSADITHLKSSFQAYASPFPAAALDLPDLFAHLQSLNPRIKRATHCIYAWHTSAESRSCDGGEAGAGDRLLRLLELGEYQDVVVVVYRWYGGVKLGNARWKCILGVAKDALSKGGFGRKVDVSLVDGGRRKRKK